MNWILAAILSAVFAGLTTILAKSGIKESDSDLATAIRTGVVLFFSVVMCLITGASPKGLDGQSVIFLTLSGLCTGLSWLCYFRALKTGDASKVVPVDKSSTVLTVIAAFFLFGEFSLAKLIGLFPLSAGIFLMAYTPGGEKKQGGPWFFYACGSAVFACLTTVFSKYGLSHLDSNMATAFRTAIVLVLCWGIVFCKRKHREIKHISRKEMSFILLSGIATGASWLFYYYALKNGSASVVAPIDKMSVAVTVLLSFIIFKEKPTARNLFGLALMLTGTLVMVL